MGMSFWHMLMILIVVFIVFGAGRLPKVMGDVGKGIRHLREGLKGEEETKSNSALPPVMPQATVIPPSVSDDSRKINS